jgi:hypothetical protein
LRKLRSLSSKCHLQTDTGDAGTAQLSLRLDGFQVRLPFAGDGSNGPNEGIESLQAKAGSANLRSGAVT